MTLRDTNIAIQIDTEEAIVTPEKFTKPFWWDNDLDSGYHDRCRAVVKAFVTGNFTKKMTTTSKGASRGHYRHVYMVKGDDLWLHKNNPKLKVKICIAKKVAGGFVGNSSAIMAMRTLTGKIVFTGGQQIIQRTLSDVMPMVPFSVFKEARLDINQFSIVEKGADEILDVGTIEPIHFTGALLFKIGVRNKSRGVMGESERYYLCDFDRNDLKMKNSNFFLSRLSRPAVSIKDAYDSLKPKEVSDAERFMSEPCRRQGEWFFIPVPGEFKNQTTTFDRPGRPALVSAVLQAKGNRPHNVTELSVEGYVRGKVTHGGHEHLPIYLKQWHKPVCNLAAESFKISGAVD